MYVYAKIMPVETVLGIWRGRIRRAWRTFINV
jgi:hypothetical protein